MKVAVVFVLSTIVFSLTSCGTTTNQPSSSMRNVNTLQPTAIDQNRTKLTNALKH